MTDTRITREEMVAMFGNTLPIEAVKLVWVSPGGRTIGELRDELRRIAASQKDEPPAELVEIAAGAIAQFWAETDTPEDAARAVLAAVTPQIEARAREEGVRAMQWQDIATAPKGVSILGRRDPSHTGRQLAFVGEVYDLRENALIDVWSGKWAVCTHWAPIPALDPAQVAGGKP